MSLQINQNTQRPVQTQADKPGSQTRSPLVTPRPQRPLPPPPAHPDPARPTRDARFPPLPPPAGIPGPRAGTAQTGSWAPYLRGPPTAPGAASSPAGAAHTSRLRRARIRRDSTQLPLQVQAVGEGRAASSHRRELEPAGPLQCPHPARLPLNLGTAASHSLPSAPPPPHRTPPNSPPPTRTPPRSASAPRLWEHPSLHPSPWTLAHLPRGRAALPRLLGTAPRSEGHSPVSWRGGGTRAGSEPLLPSLGAIVKSLGGEGRTALLGPTKHAPGWLARPASPPDSPTESHARDAVAGSPAGPGLAGTLSGCPP